MQLSNILSFLSLAAATSAITGRFTVFFPFPKRIYVLLCPTPLIPFPFSTVFARTEGCAPRPPNQTKPNQPTNHPPHYSGVRPRLRQRGAEHDGGVVLGRHERADHAVRVADAGRDPAVPVHRGGGGGDGLELGGLRHLLEADVERAERDGARRRPRGRRVQHRAQGHERPDERTGRRAGPDRRRGRAGCWERLWNLR